MKTDVLDVKFDGLTMHEALERAEALMDRSEREEGAPAPYIVTPNPEIVWLCRKNPDLARAVSAAALTLPDGIGIIYGAKILKRPCPNVAGFDLPWAFSPALPPGAKACSCWGQSPAWRNGGGEAYPSGLVIAGTQDGYFRRTSPFWKR